MVWQTNMDVFSPYPWRCKSFQEMNNHTDNAFQGEDGENQTAFHCRYATQYRIIEEECLGDECPYCELVGMDEYIKEMEQ